MVSIHIHDRHGHRVLDQGAEGSQGTVGTAYGGRPRHAPRPQKPPGVKAGGFTVDNPPPMAQAQQQPGQKPVLPGTHQAAAQQHEALAAHHQGLNYGAQNPVSRAHSEAAKAHKAAHGLLGKPGYQQAANWANSATEHAGRLSKPPQDAAAPPQGVRQGPQQTGPDIKAGSNQQQPPRPAAQPYRGYDYGTAEGARKREGGGSPDAGARQEQNRRDAARLAHLQQQSSNPFAGQQHAAEIRELRSRLSNHDAAGHSTVDAWFHDAGTPLGARRAHSTRRRIAAEDEAKKRRSWLDNWFGTKKRGGYSDHVTVDEWFHDFDESKVKRDHGRFAEQSGGGEVKEPRRSVSVRREDGSIEQAHMPDDVVEIARSLKDDPEKYFNVDKEGTQMVPVEKLVQKRARPEGIANAAKYMKAAYQGEYGKRDPIFVQKLEDGHYMVLDGNSTTTIATLAGWEHLPAIELPDASYLPQKPPKPAKAVDHRTIDQWFRDFDPSKHPKGGNPENTGQFSKGSGGGSGGKSEAKSETKPSEGGRKRASNIQVKPGTRPPGRGAQQAASTHRVERPDLIEASKSTQPPPPVDKATLKGDMTTPKTTVKQPVKNIDDLYDKSKEAEADFIQDVSDLAGQYGGRALFTPAEYAEPGTTLKSMASANEKLKEEGVDGDPAQLFDILRGTVATKDVKTARAAALDFIEYMGDKVTRVKDRIVNPSGGYRDILVNFKCPNGIIAELQFNSENLLHEKNHGEGHKLYEISREVKRNYAKMEIPHKEQQILEYCDWRSVELYEAAYQKDGNGNWR